MKKNALILFLALISASINAGTYSGGAGTSGAPYQISNLNDLLELSTTPADWAAGLYFIQTADIDASPTSGWNGGLGFTPIGNNFSGYFPFAGSYDGQNHTISNLYINRPSNYGCALFGYVNMIDNYIQNIILTSVNITANFECGGIAGSISSGTIQNCTVSGSVSGSGFGSTGGIVGSLQGGNIIQCSSSGSVSGTDNVGGIIGAFDNAASNIKRCVSTANVTLTGYYGGGIAGWFRGTMENCYARGSVGGGSGTTRQNRGGLIGLFSDVGVCAVTNCYSTGAVSGYSNLGGMIGRRANSTVPTSSYWDKQTSGRSTSVGGTGKTTAEMKTQSTFTGWDFTTPIWSLKSSYNGGYPNLDGQADPAVIAPAAQPTNLYFSTTITSGNYNYVLHYTASASAEKYLIVRKTGSAPSFVPSNGTEYTAGVQGSDQVVYVGTAVTATDATVTSNTAYYYKIYAYNGSAATTKYLTTTPLSGNTTAYSAPAALPFTSATIAAGFPNAGVNVTFPGGTTGTTLTVTKTAASPASNFSALPGVKGVKSLYFTITSSNATPGTYTVVMDFSGLSLTDGQWANFKVLKRADAASAWVDVTSVGATIVSRQIDGVWGKFTISGLTSFSEFALGESFDGAIVSNLNQDIMAAMAGNTVNFNAQAITTNETNYDLTWVTLSIWNADAPANAVLKLYGAATNGEIDLAGGVLVTFGTPTLGDLIGDNYNARFYTTSPASYTLQANTTYWLVFSSSTISDFNTTLSLGYSGAGTLPSVKNNAQSDDGGISYTYYDDQPFLIAVNGNIIPTVITWTGGNNTTNWNTAANWDMNTVPTEYDLVTIPGTGVTYFPMVSEPLDTPAVCYDLTIETGGLLSISAGKALTVNGTLTNNMGMTGLSIESDLANGSGSLLHHTANIPAWFSVTIPGAAELTDFKYHLVSVPLTPAGNSTSIIFDGLYLYDFDVAGNAWNSLGTSTTTILDETKGYMVYKLGGDINLLFEGNMNAGAFSSTVVNTGDGYNLVPNPYPSSIDWNAASGWTKTNINNATWIWNSTASTPYGPGIVGNYAAFVGGTGTNGGSRYIAPGQAFFVKTNAASPVLTMTDAVRLHNATPFLKSGESIADLLRIKAIANNYSDEVVIRFTGEATPLADAAFDAEKMYGLENAPQLYTLTQGNEKLSINSLPAMSGQNSVPLNFETQFTGVVNLTFANTESFDPSINIYLKDELTNQTINLRTQSAYTFNHNPTNDANRFKLIFGGTYGIEEDESHAGNMWITGNTLYINTPKLAGEKAKVEVYNAAGQSLLTKNLVLDGLTTFDLNLQGFVIVKLTSGQTVLTAKGILIK